MAFLPKVPGHRAHQERLVSPAEQEPIGAAEMQIKPDPVALIKAVQVFGFFNADFAEFEELHRAKYTTKGHGEPSRTMARQKQVDLYKREAKFIFG